MNATAFNLGCEARLLGRPRTTNPYQSALNKEWRAWECGWLDVHYNWGIWAKRRSNQLPLVA